MTSFRLPQKISRRQLLGAAIAAGYQLSAGFDQAVWAQSAKSAAWKAANKALALTVDDEGNYVVFLKGKKWLVSSPISIHVAGTWYTNGKGVDQPGQTKTAALKKINSSNGNSEDKLGSNKWHTINWQAADTAFDTTFKVYDQNQCIVFSQSFPKGAAGLSLPQRHVSDSAPEGVNGPVNTTDVSTAFPNFAVSSLDKSISYLSYQGCMAHPQRGRQLDNFYGGTQAGVPLILFNEELQTTVISPLNHFANAVQVRSEMLEDSLACGLSGRVNEVPEGFAQETILFGGDGVNQTVYDWGSQLLAVGGKSRNNSDKDLTANYIGYWTDNGAFYYYNTEPGKNYETTMVDVADYLKKENLPIAYLQLDSWWYLKGKDEGTALWEPRSEVFADGLNGLKAKVNLPFSVHNRYWSSTNQYKDRFRFIVDKTAALPENQEFWRHIMKWAKENGIILYEQDWLNVAYERVKALQTDVLFSEKWLSQMSHAADEQGISIMYCMPLPSHYLESTHCSAVTQIRASGDYCPGKDQWKLGLNTMLSWSLGLAPFKDDFWSSEIQTGNTYDGGTVKEPNFELQTIVAALSRGGVGPADKIGCLNRDLVMKTCRADGLILKPDRPAMTIERCFKPDYPKGEIWDTSTTIGASAWRFLLVADQTNPYQLTASDIGVNSPHAMLEIMSGKHRLIDKNETLSVGGTEPPRVGATQLQYFIIAPQNADGTAFFGESNKFISISPQRFESIENDGKKIGINGAPGEIVELSWRCEAPPKWIKLDGKNALEDAFTKSYKDHIFKLSLTLLPSGERAIELFW